MESRSRLLALAFAAADALVELDKQGVVAFAAGVGAVPEQGVKSWIGRPLSDLLGAASRTSLAEVLDRMSPGVRSSPAAVVVLCPDGQVRRATLRAFQLPDLAPAVSCALSWEGEPFRLDLPQVVPLATPAQFLDRARDVLKEAGPDARIGLAFVDVPGLAEAPETTGRRVEASLQAASHDGRTASRLTTERFAVLRDAQGGPDLAEEVRRAGEIEGVALEPIAAEVALTPGPSSVNALRALRFTIEGCLREGGMARPDQAFGEQLKRTLREADQFTSVVRGRQFELHWQPIVDLDTRAVHHFEGLTRFGAGNGPAPVIHMAEELGLIESFDLAVLEKAVARLMAPGGRTLTLAVNVSAHSLAGDAYVAALLRMTQLDPALRRRLMIEVTETAALADVEAAGRRIDTLRAAGVRACIDDFGAGAASFDWLRGLAVDFVKIDGAFVRQLEKDPRTSTLIAHLVALCASLKVEVIGEMIEDETTADQLRDLGVRYGQGWLFGRAEAEPILVRPTRAAARRMGVVEAWG